jgi:pyruvate/2-oxoglutarate dehydrogenase complex dihydrolipoamide dehydrogenase (E3) component
MTGTEYDLIVIGAGAVGENVADRAVQGGLTALIIESELVGGECSYWACMPSKALLRSGMVYRAAKRVGGANETITRPLDVAATFARRTAIIHDWDDEGQVEWLKGAHIDLARGHARITGIKGVTVGDTVYTARHAVCVSTGSAALMPDIPGLKESQPWSSREATSATVAPKSLAIIGGGVVAAEMATAYASFGTAVTVIARSGLLAGQEPFAGDLVAESLRELGATLHLKSSPTAVSKKDDSFVIELDNGPTVTADELLVATGRVPRSTDLGLENIGLKPGSWLDVDDTMRVTGFDWLYATGDINHRALLTHQGKYQARAAGDVIAARALGKPVYDGKWGTHAATADHEAVPQVTFADPEVASVGLTSAAAEKAGYDIRVVDYDMSWLAGTAIQADGYKGKARMVVDEKRKVIIGVTFVGQDVSELLQAATFAIVGEIPLDRLWHGVPAYPTMNEIWLRLLETYGRPA